MGARDKMKMELKASVSQLENSGKAFQVEGSIQKIEYQDAMINKC